MPKNIAQKRVSLSAPPYLCRAKPAVPPWELSTEWPGTWISLPAALPPLVAAYRLLFDVAQPETIRFHVSADERYELYCDGILIGRGSERGDLNNWFFETYDIDFPNGAHSLVTKVWSLGAEHRPWAQTSVKHRFLLSPDDEKNVELFATGVAPWQAMRIDGYSLVAAPGIGTGSKLLIDGSRIPWGFECGIGDGWGAVDNAGDAFGQSNGSLLTGNALLTPAILPAQISKDVRAGRVRHIETFESFDALSTKAISSSNDLASERIAWQRLLEGNPLTLAPESHFRAIVDLEDYYTVYPHLTVSGGSKAIVRLHWAERLFPQKGGNWNGDEIEGKTFRGVGDSFFLDGGENRSYGTLWWHAGRYLEIVVATADKELRIESLRLEETRYPLESEYALDASDKQIPEIAAASFKTLQLCAHETYMDCPYWEQMMYVGDARLEVLATYAATRDSLLPEKAIAFFDAGCVNRFMLAPCAYPSSGSNKIIPSFCFWWIAMIYDFALWRGDKPFVLKHLVGARAMLDRILVSRDALGLVKTPPGWHYIDAIDFPNWLHGIPPAKSGTCGIFNWLAVYALMKMAELEVFAGETELAARWRRIAMELARRIDGAFFDEAVNLYADELSHSNFSVHAQCLALLSGAMEQERSKRLFANLMKSFDSIAQPSIFFSHYLFEAYSLFGRGDLILKGLNPWRELKARGLKTTPETFKEGGRSDCHAWGAHPLYHFFASILGIRPLGLGETRVSIAPKLGALKAISGSMPFRDGQVKADCFSDARTLNIAIELSSGLEGRLCAGGKEYPLKSGTQSFSLPATWR